MIMVKDLIFLGRCVRLAALADGRAGNSPRVGAVLVHDDRVIGEGYHKIAGRAHAEVNCLASVRPEDRSLIPAATLYVSLEPCCIVGRSGACTNIIKLEGIKTVVFAQRDATPGVDGRSVDLLREAGVTVREYPDFAPALTLNADRAVMATLERPYITLKYARSADGYLRPEDRKAEYWITNDVSRRLVHRWRANTTAIMVGGRTVVDDDPSLTTRLFPGPDARPVIVDPRNRVTGKERLFQKPDQLPLLFAGSPRPDIEADVIIVGEILDKAALTRVLRIVLERGYGRLTVEGGAALLNALLANELWDEARVFTGRSRFGGGLPAPILPASASLVSSEDVAGDGLEVYLRKG